MKLFLLALIALTANVKAGERGNGGGGWVCRENNTQAVRWVKLIDTFEAASDPTIRATFPSSADLAVQNVLNRLSEIGTSNTFISDSASENCPYFTGLECGFTNEGSGMILPSDANTIYKPLPESCSGGKITREAVALRFQGLKVSVVRELHDKLSPADQVALALHESLYAFSSFLQKSENSDFIRPIVAKLIANNGPSLKKNEIKALKDWSSINISTYYRIMFEFRSWSDSGWVEFSFEETEFRFKKEECQVLESTGIVLGHPTSRFRCERFAEILINDASQAPRGRLTLFFPDQINQAVTRDFHLTIENSTYGRIIDFRDTMYKGAGYTKLVPIYPPFEL
jgi:hypothetical protein